MKMEERSLLLLVVAFFIATASLYAQGTAFTYQGRLNNGTNPVTGSYDLRFHPYDT